MPKYPDQYLKHIRFGVAHFNAHIIAYLKYQRQQNQILYVLDMDRLFSLEHDECIQLLDGIPIIEVFSNYIKNSENHALSMRFSV